MPDQHLRTMLVVMDDSAECRSALHYACRRAHRTGGKVALLRVIDSTQTLHQWQGIEEALLEEKREEAQEELQSLAKNVAEMVGSLPVLHVREGKTGEEALALINEEPKITLLVLGMCSGNEATNPLLDYIVTQGFSSLRTPVTIVPDTLTIEDIDQLT